MLGPLLFLVYINDLPQNISSSVRLFADDCVLYRQIENQIDAETLQKDLSTLVKWEKDWQMHFNPEKCFVLRLTHKRNPLFFNYKLGKSVLQDLTNNHSYLGFIINNNLTWNNHINQILLQPTVHLDSYAEIFIHAPSLPKSLLIKPLSDLWSSIRLQYGTHTLKHSPVKLNRFNDEQHAL